MKRIFIISLQILTLLIGVGAFVFLLLEPHFEGRNVNTTLFQIYFNDPFLAYAYTGSIAFFVGLYQVFMFLGYVGQNKTYSLQSAKSVRIIKYCAFIIIGFIVPALIYLSLVMRGKDDIAGGMAMGLMIIALSSIVVFAASHIEKRLQHKLTKESGVI